MRSYRVPLSGSATRQWTTPGANRTTRESEWNCCKLSNPDRTADSLAGHIENGFRNISSRSQRPFGSVPTDINDAHPCEKSICGHSLRKRFRAADKASPCNTASKTVDHHDRFLLATVGLHRNRVDNVEGPITRDTSGQPIASQ